MASRRRRVAPALGSGEAWSPDGSLPPLDPAKLGVTCRGSRVTRVESEPKRATPSTRHHWPPARSHEAITWIVHMVDGMMQHGACAEVSNRHFWQDADPRRLGGLHRQTRGGYRA